MSSYFRTSSDLKEWGAMPINILKLHLLLDYVYEKYTLINKNLTYWFSHQFSVFVSLYFLGEKANENCQFSLLMKIVNLFGKKIIMVKSWDWLHQILYGVICIADLDKSALDYLTRLVNV